MTAGVSWKKMEFFSPGIDRAQIIILSESEQHEAVGASVRRASEQVTRSYQL